MELEHYYISIPERVCECCGTKFEAKTITIPFEILINILIYGDKRVLIVYKLISNKIASIVFPKILNQLKSHSIYRVYEHKKGDSSHVIYTSYGFEYNNCITSYYFGIFPDDNECDVNSKLNTNINSIKVLNQIYNCDVISISDIKSYCYDEFEEHIRYNDNNCCYVLISCLDLGIGQVNRYLQYESDRLLEDLRSNLLPILESKMKEICN